MAKQILQDGATFGVQTAKINDNFTELYEGKVDVEVGKSLIDDSEIIRLASVTNQTKGGLGLSNVDNTSDVNKPVSNATATAISGKVDKETGKSLVLNTEIAKLATYATEQYVTNAIAAIPPSESGAFQGTITLASVPTADGLYIPTEAGTYANAGGLIYAPSTTDANKLIQFSKKGAVWTKISIPVTTALDNKVTATSGNSVKSSGIYDQIKSETKSIANKDLGLIVGNNSTMNGNNSWVANLGSPSFDVNSSIPNKMQITFTAGVNQNIQLNDVFKDIPNGTDFDISLKVRLVSGSPSALTIGAFTPAGTSVFKATPTSTETILSGTVKAGNTQNYFSIGLLSADNNGCVVSIDDVIVRYKGYITQESKVTTLDKKITDNKQEIAEITDVVKVGKSVITGNNSVMLGNNDWIATFATGAVTISVNDLVQKTMAVHFPTTANGAITLSNSLVVGKTYIIKMKMRQSLGNGKLYVGAFVSSNFGTKTATLQPTSEFKEYTFEITAASVDLYIFNLFTTTDSGVGYDIEISKITAYDKSLYPFINQGLDALYSDNTSNLTSFNCDIVWGSLSKRVKPLLKICVLGDSLNANPIGGDIPDVEPENERPMRLGTKNTISRRIYDYLSWNKPIHRKLPHVDWTKTGTWTEITSGVFDPSASETLFENSTANSYIEIAVPSGKENFAIMLQENADNATVDVTLNGGSISSYGLSVINTVIEGTSIQGNAYKTIEYIGLPTGINTIRFTKRADTKKFVVWGGFYWSGNTIVVHNISHGGHKMETLYGARLKGDFANNFDAVYFQLTEMNEQGSANSSETSILSMNKIFNDYIKEIPLLVSSCHPMGKVGAGTNFYTAYQTPQTHKQLNDALKKELYIQKRPFIDIFKMFERKVISRGGTLENGDAGVYTTDGQHGNELGVDEWFTMLKQVLKNCPLRD